MNANHLTLEILNRASKEGLPQQVGPEDTLETIAIYAELVDAGYLTGHIVLGADGRPCNVAGARITAFGREHLEQLEKDRAERSRASVTKNRALWMLRWVVLPVALAIVIAWLTKWFGLK